MNEGFFKIKRHFVHDRGVQCLKARTHFILVALEHDGCKSALDLERNDGKICEIGTLDLVREGKLKLAKPCDVLGYIALVFDDVAVDKRKSVAEILELAERVA